MNRKPRAGRTATIRYGILAGAAGGVAEIVWLLTMSALTGISAENVARGVTASVGIDALSSTPAVLIGIATHMALAITLGIAVAVGCYALVGRSLRGIHAYTVVPAALIGVWAFNFLILLPLINPAFVQLVPYPISLLSKILFGLAAAEVLRRGARNDRR